MQVLDTSKSVQHLHEILNRVFFCQTDAGFQYVEKSLLMQINIAMIHIPQIKAALGISGVYTRHSSWTFKGDDTLPGAQIDMIIDRADQIIHLCEAKFTIGNYAITPACAEQLRLKKMIFKQATQTRKAVFTTLLTTYPALKNKHYVAEIDNEITMDKLFLP